MKSILQHNGMIATEESAVDTSTAGHQRTPSTAWALCYSVVTTPEAAYTIPRVLEPIGLLEGWQIAVIQN